VWHAAEIAAEHSGSAWTEGEPMPRELNVLFGLCLQEACSADPRRRVGALTLAREAHARSVRGQVVAEAVLERLELDQDVAVQDAARGFHLFESNPSATVR
jgi:hypothetical protein